MIRSHCNRIQALPNEILLITTNLPSGYHRDLQLLKEHLIPAFNNLQSCLEIAGLMISNIQVKKNILENEKYKFIFSVEEVNKLVLKGMSFRDAYNQVGVNIKKGNFKYETSVLHTHEGSIGNLQNRQIQQMMNNILQQFNFEKVSKALEQLIG